jgi:hypothetical protein
MLAAKVVSKTEGRPEQLTRGLTGNLERNAWASQAAEKCFPVFILSRGRRLTLEFQGPEGVSR